MKKIQYLSAIVSLLIIGALTTLQAQTARDSVVNRNITIEREYRPAIQDAGKMNSFPNFIEPRVVKIVPHYTDFNLPLNVEQNIHYLSAADVNYQRKELKEGFARLGAGTALNSLADFAYPLIKKSDMKLDFILNHYGVFSAKTLSTSQAALFFDKKLSVFNLYAGLGGNHDYFKYYAPSYSELNGARSNINSLPDSYGPQFNTLYRINANVGIITSPTAEKYRYGADLKYNFLNSRNGVAEHLAELNAKFDLDVREDKVGFEFDLQNQFYSTSNGNLRNTFKSYNVASFNPYYSMEREAFDVRLGIKTFSSFPAGRGFRLAPDVSFEWRAVPRYLAVYAGATGKYEINSLNSIYKENYYLSPEVAVNDTYTPLDFYAGFKVKPFTGLLIDVFADYRIIDNQYFFVNKEYGADGILHYNPICIVNNMRYFSNQFETVYSNAQHFQTGARISYIHKNMFNFELKGAYNYWNVKKFEYAWNKPVWEMDFNVSANITQKLNVYVNVGLDGGRKTILGNTVMSMNPKIDINLGASYALKDWFSVFLKVNNLINNNYQYFYGYDAQGFNVMGGITFNF